MFDVLVCKALKMSINRHFEIWHLIVLTIDDERTKKMRTRKFGYFVFNNYSWKMVHTAFDASYVLNSEIRQNIRAIIQMRIDRR